MIISNMLFEVDTFIEKYYVKDEIIVVGCSTGADSMSILYHLINSKYKKSIVACYFNHQTRLECDTEEEFLTELGKKEGFRVEVASCDFEKIMKLYPSKSFEELAREKRYQFFDAICNLYKTNKVIVGHHLDDKIETMIFNMLRGSKLTGLINMTESSGGILRPLLSTQKKDIYKYLHTHNLKYFEDSTNTDSNYSRNYLRNEVLSKFETINTEYKKNLENLGAYFYELQTYIDLEVETFLHNKKNFIIQDFKELAIFLQKEIIKHIFYLTNNKSTIGLSEKNIEEVLRFIDGPNSKTYKHIKRMYLYKEKGIISFSKKN